MDRNSRELFEANCSKCHGDGTGNGPSAVKGMVDDWGAAITPANLTLGRGKWAHTARDIYVRAMAGINGTPMPESADVLTPRARRHGEAMKRSLLPRHVDTQLRSLERVGTSDRDLITALRETVRAIWKVVQRAASEPALDTSRRDARALLARRELVQRGTCVLSALIQRGVESGAFRPGSASWAIRRLPFAIVAGACVHWVFGLATTPSLRASLAVAAALEMLRPGRSSPRGGSSRGVRLQSRAPRARASARFRDGARAGRAFTFPNLCDNLSDCL